MAGTLLVAALITAIIWALVLQPRVSTQRTSSANGGAPTSRHVYGGLPDARGYGHPIIVLTNLGYLVGYCEERKNPAWVSYSIGSITVGPAGKRLSRFITDQIGRAHV